MVDDWPLLRVGLEQEWLLDVQQALYLLDDRARTILAERRFAIEGSVPTLQELGDRFQVSRERVRQIEAAAAKELLRNISNAPGVGEAIERIRKVLGLVFSLGELSEVLDVEVKAGEVPLEVQVLLYLAGPYRITGDTVLGPRFEAALRESLGQIDQGPAPLARVRARMSELGIRENQHLPTLHARRDVRIIGDVVVRWSGSLGDKAAVVLTLHERPMSAEEIHEQIGEGSIATLKNYFGSEARFRRRGPHTWGLSEWGDEIYRGIAAGMADELRDLPMGMPVDRLKRILRGKFGIVESSVEIMSVTHPMFVREEGWIRLRENDEPYVPDTALEEARDCVVIRESWSWRHLVTHDTLRGSGHILPEAFAAMLRLFPRTEIDFMSNFGSIPFSWPSQSPNIGSLRRVAKALGAIEGDYLFVIPKDSRLGFELVRRDELTAADPSHELLLRLGQINLSGSWLSACASAIGLPPHAQLDEVEELLEVRGDRLVLRLFGVARRSWSEGLE
jgi:hypothetical protein